MEHGSSWPGPVPAEIQHGGIVIEHVQAMFDGGAVFSATEKPGSLDIVRAPAVIADLAGAHQVFEHFYQRRSPFERVIAAVQQVQVDALDLKAAQAGFAFPLDRTAIQRPGIRLLGHRIFPELGRHHDASSATSQGFTQDALAQPWP